MKRKLQISAAAFIVMSLTFLSGCTNSSFVDLGKAISNSSNVKSYSMDTSINITGYHLPNLEMNMNLKGNMTDPNNPVMSANLSSSSLGLPLTAEMYLQANADFEKNNFIIKLPVGLGLPSKFDNKYLSFSGKDIMAVDSSIPEIKPIDAGKVQLSLELQNKIEALVLKYYVSDVTAYKDIEVAQNVNVTNAGVTLDTTKYTLSINDDTLKKAIKYYFNTASKDDNFYTLIKDCLAFSNQDSNSIDFKKEFVALVDDMNKSIDDPSFAILGSKGATISFYVNNDGYIARVEGLVNFTLDNVEKQEYTINFISDIYGINNTKIEKPVVNTSNSYTIADLVKQMGEVEQIPTPAPILNKKVIIRDKKIIYRKAEYISLVDVKANHSINVRVDKNSKYIIGYNKKSLSVTPYKTTKIVYVKHKKQTIVNVYLPIKSLKSLGLAIIDQNIITKEKPVNYKKNQYVSLTDVKRNTSVTIHVDKKSKYVVSYNGKTITVSPYKVNHIVYVKHKKQVVSKIYLPSKSLKGMGLVIKNS